MKKKILIPIFAILVLAVAAGGFFWWQNKKTLAEKWEGAKYSWPEDFIVKESPEGKIVENQKVGLIYRILEGWILTFEDNPSIFHTLDKETSEKRSDVLEKGCEIYVDIAYIKTTFEDLQMFRDKSFRELSRVIKIDEFSKVEINNHPALKYKYYVENLKMAYISIESPIKNKVFQILLVHPNETEEKERCETEFNEFLETISIK